MSGCGTETDLVTGAFSYSGSRIAELVIESGREVRTLTHHVDREHPLRASVPASPYRFDDPLALAHSLEGITTLYNTYWVRFERGRTTFADAVDNSRALFEAARRAGVARIVHLSTANPSIDSSLPYYRGKALVEQALADADVRYSIVRPTWIFGGGRDILANNVAWILRHVPIFVVPGDGRYRCSRSMSMTSRRSVCAPPAVAPMSSSTRRGLTRCPLRSSCERLAMHSVWIGRSFTRRLLR